jgi:hypothetical protein
MTGWQEFTFSAATATSKETTWDPAKIRIYGVQFATGTGTPTGTGSPPSGKPTPAVIHIDSFSLE